MKWQEEIQNYKLKDKLDTIKNIKDLYNSRENAIKLFNDYARIRSEAMYKTKQGTEIKILTPKKMLQRLPITLAQVKEGNTSESLLNEIRQIVYFCIIQKRVLKKYIKT